ncbi:hypothetical protein NUU61_010139 [Penicillium alfredii]|uniref:Phytanoyl-CoA dioxygenase n=1 Tax=Penicillium alfredii TaxID=1506179 RepID=A0A9W9EHJ5_9EURO|nr:uncharacterized protein NUU61_010139 [Penicillium alfredii]KAJ5081875.1 hypothetical protein NUU61_010139 [Penicillium alfredii]
MPTRQKTDSKDSTWDISGMTAQYGNLQIFPSTVTVDYSISSPLPMPSSSGTASPSLTSADIFAKIWGTDELTVSYGMFGGGGGTMALPAEEAVMARLLGPILIRVPTDLDLTAFKACRTYDGGHRSSFGQYFKHHEAPEGGWIKRDLFHWTDEKLQWFKDRGCEWVKPSMDPGDFILWDSRAVHHGAAPLGNNKHTCYKPIEFLAEEQRERKVEAFKRGYMTSHDPTDFVLKQEQMADWNILHPYGPPTINKATQQTIGMTPYD